MQIKRILTAPIAVPDVGAGGEVAQALSVGLLLADGRVAWGDCVGTGPAPAYDEALGMLRRVVALPLEGRNLAGFRELAAEIDALTETITVTRQRQPAAEERNTKDREGFSRRALLTAPTRLFQGAEEKKEPETEEVMTERRLHPAIRYGVSQALLQAVALARGRTMAQVVGDEWDLDLANGPVPIHAWCDREADRQVEAAVRQRVASLPQAPVRDVAEQVEADGGGLTRYLRRLAERIAALAENTRAEGTRAEGTRLGDEYRPAIHLDLAGALGQITDQHPGHMLGHLYTWRMAAGPYPLWFEDPVLLEDRQAQIEAMWTLHDYLRLRKIDVQLVAGRGIETPAELIAFLAGPRPGNGPPVDMIHLRMPQLGSLHNAVEGVLACQRMGVKVLMGGSPAETDVAARVAAHVALATRPDLVLARPGREVDVAVGLVGNEMVRTLVAIGATAGHGGIET